MQRVPAVWKNTVVLFKFNKRKWKDIMENLEISEEKSGTCAHLTWQAKNTNFTL